MKEVYFKIYAHNVAVKGKERSAVYDLQNQDIVIIPNVLFLIINDLKSNPIEAVRMKYAPDSPDIFNKYIDFLLNKNIGFLTHSPELFPSMNFDWHESAHIENAVIEYSTENYDISKVFAELDELLCKYVELRLKKCNMKALNQIFKYADGLTFKSMDCYVEYHASFSIKKIEQLYKKFTKIGKIIVYNAPLTHKSTQNPDNIIFTQLDLAKTMFESHFPKNKYFVNIRFFTEALHRNPYYNQKICIDEFGNIKNSLLIPKNYGNVNFQGLYEVIENTEFKNLWHVNADKIEGLRDSELRYAVLATDELTPIGDGSYRVVGQ